MVSTDPTLSEPRMSERRGPAVNGQGIASLVFGAIGVAVSFVPVLGLPALILGPLAIVFALIGRAGKPRDTTCATAGLILGVTATVVVLFVTLIFGSSLAKLRDSIPANPFASTSFAEDVESVTVEPVQEAPKFGTTPQSPEKNCGPDGVGDAESGSEVTFIVESIGDSAFDVDYGSTAEPSCFEGSRDYWENTLIMSDPERALISAYTDATQDAEGALEQDLRCQIIVDGEVVAEETGTAATSCGR